MATVPKGKDLVRENARKRRRCCLLAVSAAAVYLQLSNHALAATETWTADNGDWDTASNWNNGAGPVPGSNDTVDITNNDSISRTVTYNYTGSVVTLESLTIDNYGIGTNTLSLSDPQLLETDNEYLGNSNTSVKPGWGVVTQSTGINFASGALYLGYGADDEGFYTLSGSGVLQAGDEYVGYNGGGTVNQPSGTNIVTSTLYLGYNSGASGQYTLGGGSLSVNGNENIGSSGTFNQTGGTNTIEGSLYVAATSSNSGIYSLSGTGVLSAAVEYLNGTVNQSGGSNSNSTALFLGYDSTGIYNLSGGSISSPQENIGFFSNGTFNQTGGTNMPGALDLGQEYGHSGSYTLASGATLSASGEDIGVYGAGTFDQTGGLNTASGLSLNGYYQPSVSCQYTLSGSGSLSISGSEDVGLIGAGTFSQMGGTNTVGSNLYLGYEAAGGSSYPAASGQYALSGGSLAVTGDEYIGYSGTGTFVQNGGASTATNLYVGYNSGSTGLYSLSGSGSLSISGNEIVGEAGAGTFNQTGGTNAIGGALDIGNNVGSSGSTYNLSGTGSLMASVEYVGVGEEGFLLQTTGTNTVTNDLVVGGTDDGPGALAELYVEGGKLTVGGILRVWSNQSEIYITAGSVVTAGAVENLSFIDQEGGTSSLGFIFGGGNFVLGYSGEGSTPTSMTVTAIIQNSVDIESSGTLTLLGGAPNNTINELTINRGMFNITNGHIIIDYGSGPDPISSIAAWIASGYAGGAWDGPGIMSTVAQDNSGSYGIGYADSADPGNPADLSSGTIEIMYTLLGDANLDGKVNGTDFEIMATNFNQSGRSWDQGDFNYDGNVNGSDFVLLADNFNQFASQSDVSAADLKALDSFAAANGISLANVPEPASLALGAGVLSALIARRRLRDCRM
jgi:hypothetical protein